MIAAGERAISLVTGRTIDLDQDATRRDAVLWNFTVLGEAAGQISEEVRDRHPGVAWQNPIRLRNRIVRLLVDRPRDPVHDGNGAPAELRRRAAIRGRI
jgi:uncharacterized protein with HEPN domain